MLTLFAFAGTFIINSATASTVGTSSCGQVFELAAAQQRWTSARENQVDRAHNEKICRTYGIHFYEAVMARQTVSICRDGRDHQRDLERLDFEIDAFNNLIATQCGSQ